MADKIDTALTVLMAEDDPDDLVLLREAFDENSFEGVIKSVSDGVELLNYLRNKGRYSDRDLFPKPDLILLDLNMPKKDGREALAEIKADPELRFLPVVVLTTSNSHEDIIQSYSIGANSFIIKPTTFKALVKIVKNLRMYWFHTAKLPPVRRSNG
jgi:CheY-like chemotaxis protein